MSKNDSSRGSKKKNFNRHTIAKEDSDHRNSDYPFYHDEFIDNSLAAKYPRDRFAKKNRRR